MIHALIGTKIGQTQQFTDNGTRMPVTKLQVGPCWIIRIIDDGRIHSYQLGFGTAKRLDKATEQNLKKAGIEQKPRFFREIRVDELYEGLNVGDKVQASDVFRVGDHVRVVGKSKGKGFAGVMKRHGFHGGPKTHGQSDRARAPGPIGQSATPGRVYRGKKMAGRMGNERITAKGLRVVGVDADQNIVFVKGLVPGAKNGLVIVAREGKSLEREDATREK